MPSAFYHGTPSRNTQKILTQGILYKPVDLEKTLQDGIDKVKNYFGIGELSPIAIRRARERLRESRDAGGVIYVSSSKDYASQNALAAGEWLDILIENGLREKYKDLYARAEKVGDESMKRLEELKKLDAKRRELFKNPDLTREQLDAQRARERIVESEYHRSGREHDKYLDEIKNLKDKAEEDLFGRTATLFELRIPRSEAEKLFPVNFMEFKRRSIDPKYLKEWLQEATAKSIPPKYIVGYSPIQKAEVMAQK